MAEVYGLDVVDAARLRWGDLVAQLITHRHPYTDVASALSQHPADEIKAVVEW